MIHTPLLESRVTRDLSALLHRSSSRHDHLCPRQVLGVRMGLAGFSALSLEAPLLHKEALVIIETDGCFADGIEAATGAAVGHRTLRVEDLGKIAATFVRVADGAALRLAPRSDVRERAALYAAESGNSYQDQLQGYQIMPDAELFQSQEVRLEPPLELLLSSPGLRAVCSLCGEEIINERQVLCEGRLLCRTCAAGSYYLVK